MSKRIATFVLSLVVVIGIFLTYQWITGTSMLFAPKKPTVTEVKGSERDRPVSIEVRRPTGELEYVLNAARAVQAKNDHGDPIPGQYLLTSPSATYHFADGRIVFIRADAGTLVIDQVNGLSLTASGAAGAKKPTPKGGKLSGHVVLTIGPQESFTDNTLDLKPGQIQARLDKDLEFDYTQRLLTSPGKIHVRSDQIAFDGEELTLAFNPDEKRIEFLRIDKGDTVIIKRVGSAGLGLGLGAPSASTTQTADVATPPAVENTTAPASNDENKLAPTTYKLSFGRDVKATVGKRALTSDQLYVLFRLAGGEVTSKAGKPAATEPAEVPGTPSPIAPVASHPATNMTKLAATQPAPFEPLSEPAEDDLVVHWTGSMEMRPSGPEDLILTTSKDWALEAVGTVQHPVVVQDQDTTATSGRTWLHRGEMRVKLEPGEVGKVELADPKFGKVVCQGVSGTMDAQGKSIQTVFEGPAQAEVPQSVLRRGDEANAQRGRPLVASWKKGLTLDWVSVPDIKNPGKNTWTVRHAAMTGNAQVTDAAFSIGADLLDVLISYTGETKTPQAFEKLLATGNVQVRSARGDHGPDNLSDEGHPDGLSAGKLEVLTQVPPGAKAPVPASLIATDDVVAWTYTEKGAAGAAKDQKKFTRQQISTPHMEVALETKDRGTAAETRNPDTLGGTQARLLTATDGVTVEIEGFGNLPVIAKCQTLTAEPKAGTATLEGVMQPNGIMQPARLQQGGNQIAGAKVLLDQKRESLEIPGNGEFTFFQPSQKKDDAGSPVQVTWTKRMTYSGKDLLAAFYGDVSAKLLSKEDQTSELKCDDVLEVKLEETSETADGSKKPRLGQIIASGHVKAEGASLDAQKKPITRVYLQAPKLIYTEATRTLDVPVAGSLLVEDFRADPKGNQNANGRGQTAFSWKDKLQYAGNTGTITFRKEVHMVHVPVKPFKMPAADAAKGSRVDLSCDSLSATLVQSKEAGGGDTIASPVALGTGGNQKLSKVVADGGAVLSLNENELSADTLEFDALANKAVATGKNGNAATFTGNNAGGSADQILWDLTKDQNAFTLIRPRGDIQTPN